MMNTKTVLTSSALIMGVAGVVLSFLPREIAVYVTIDPSREVVFLFQILGALYFGFAIHNWMIKSNRIGGIYHRPAALGNFIHFTVAGLALIKGLFANPDLPDAMWVLGILYTLFAVLFGIILFRHPISDQQK